MFYHITIQLWKINLKLALLPSFLLRLFFSAKEWSSCILSIVLVAIFQICIMFSQLKSFCMVMKILTIIKRTGYHQNLHNWNKTKRSTAFLMLSRCHCFNIGIIFKIMNLFFFVLFFLLSCSYDFTACICLPDDCLIIHLMGRS